MENDKIGVQLETAGAFPLDRKMYFNSIEEFENYPNKLKFDGMMIVIRQGAARGTYIYDKNTDSIAPSVQGVSKMLYISGESFCGNGDVIDRNVLYGNRTLRTIELTDGTCLKGSFLKTFTQLNSENIVSNINYVVDVMLNGNQFAQFVFNRTTIEKEFASRANFTFDIVLKRVSETDFSFYQSSTAFFQWQNESIEEKSFVGVSLHSGSDFTINTSTFNIETKLTIKTNPEIVIPSFEIGNFIMEKAN